MARCHGNQGYQLHQALEKTRSQEKGEREREGLSQAWPSTMASTKDKGKKSSHTITQEQILKEEQMLEKIADFTKLVRSWEQGRAAGLQLAKMEDISLAKIKQRQQAEIKEELYQANKQLTMVRREALRHRLRNEHLQYQLELNHLGKSFYVERL